MDVSLTIADKTNIDSNAIDQSTLEGGGGSVVKVKNSGITETQLATSVAGSGLSGGAGTALAVNVDSSTIEINSDTLRVKASGITSNELATNSVTTDKIANSNVTSAKIQSSVSLAGVTTTSDIRATNSMFMWRGSIQQAVVTSGQLYETVLMSAVIDANMGGYLYAGGLGMTFSSYSTNMIKATYTNPFYTGTIPAVLISRWNNVSGDDVVVQESHATYVLFRRADSIAFSTETFSFMVHGRLA